MTPQQHQEPEPGLATTLRWVVASLVACLALSAAAAPTAQQETATVTGHYTTAFETSSFVECGNSESWWVEGPAIQAVDAFLRDLRGRTAGEGAPLEDGTVFLTWRGRLSGRGEYGHLGAYARLFTAVEILEIRAPGDVDCESAGIDTD